MFMYHVVIYTHIYGRGPSRSMSRTYAHICRYMYTRIYTLTYIAEWSVVRDIGEAKLHPFLFLASIQETTDLENGQAVVDTITSGNRTHVEPLLIGFRYSCRKSSRGIILILISRTHESSSYARTRRATQRVHKNSGLLRIPYLSSSLNDGIDRRSRATCSLRH